MRRAFTLLAFCLTLSFGSFAQHCSGPATTITPPANLPAGLSPADSLQPCAVTGQAVTDTFYFKVPTTITASGVGTITINSIKIDSLFVPAGLCWVSNSNTNTFTAGQSGVIYISGIPAAPAGQYKLRMSLTADVGFTTVSQLDPEYYLGWIYRLRVICPTASCPALDNAHADSALAFIPYSCPVLPVATITPAGADTICQGDSVTLTALAGAGFSYRWSDAAHSRTASIRVSTAGAYTVTVYAGQDSAISAPTAIVTNVRPNNLLTLSGAATICAGDSVTISAATGSGFTYLWNNNDTTRSITIGATGTYAVTVYHGTGIGCDATNSQAITVNTVPADVILQTSGTLVSQQASSYQWYRDSIPLAGANAQSYLPTQNGGYYVAVTYATGCSTSSNTITVTSMGISDIATASGIALYPNPNNGVFTLQTTNIIGAEFTIYDIIGRAVSQQSITADKMNVDVKGLATGTYTLAVKAVNSKILRFTINQ